MKTVKLNIADVDKAFASSTNQTELLNALFTLVFPDFDKIKQVKGFPKINQKTNEEFFKRALKFDKEKCPEVLAGGLWMNYGFSSVDSENLPDWTVDLSNVEVIYGNG